MNFPTTQKNSAAIRSRYLRWVTASMLLAVFSSMGNVLFSQTPNIVILFADDLGYGKLGCQGNPEIPTPHRFHRRQRCAFHFRVVTGPNCSPSRGTAHWTDTHTFRIRIQSDRPEMKNRNRVCCTDHDRRSTAKRRLHDGCDRQVASGWTRQVSPFSPRV